VETLLLRDGLLTEGSASNVFVVRAGIVFAPAKSNLMLAGITYDVVLELAQANGIAYELRSVTQAELNEADEIWITSSSKEILPVTMLNGRPVGNGKPGPIFQRMHDLYQSYKAQVMRAPSQGH
jgi:D-alanine transaminase